MGTIIGRHYTPYDKNNNRDTIHPETQVDAVLDPVTGIPLRETLERIDATLVPVDASLNRDGLMTAALVEKYDNMLSNGIVVSNVKPSSSSTTIWENVYDPSTTIVEPL